MSALSHLEPLLSAGTLFPRWTREPRRNLSCQGFEDEFTTCAQAKMMHVVVHIVLLPRCAHVSLARSKNCLHKRGTCIFCLFVFCCTKSMTGFKLCLFCTQSNALVHICPNGKGMRRRIQGRVPRQSRERVTLIPRFCDFSNCLEKAKAKAERLWLQCCFSFLLEPCRPKLSFFSHY